MNLICSPCAQFRWCGVYWVWFAARGNGVVCEMKIYLFMFVLLLIQELFVDCEPPEE